MSKIILQGYLVVPDGDLTSVQTELPKHVALTREEEGCLVFRVTQGEENKNIYNVYEEFVSREAFELHQQRVKSSRWGKVTANAERHYQISEDY